MPIADIGLGFLTSVSLCTRRGVIKDLYPCAGVQNSQEAKPVTFSIAKNTILYRQYRTNFYIPLCIISASVHYRKLAPPTSKKPPGREIQTVLYHIVWVYQCNHSWYKMHYNAKDYVIGNAFPWYSPTSSMREVCQHQLYMSSVTVLLKMQASLQISLHHMHGSTLWKASRVHSH